MAKINLLPWREELRSQLNQEFGIIVGITAGIAVVVIVLVSTFYGHLISKQAARNKFMTDQITLLDNKIREIKELEAKKERLLQRITTIQQLQTNRTEIVHLFDETVKAVPDGIYLTSLQQKGSVLTLSGVAESNTRVSEFVRNIDASQWMTAPKIDVISRNKDTALQTNNFTLQLKQSNPNSKQRSEEEDES